MIRSFRPLPFFDWRYVLQDARIRATNRFDRSFNPAAASFYNALVCGGFSPNTFVDVLPDHGVIYVCVPKSASTTIRMTLSALVRRHPVPPDALHKRRYSGLRSPRGVGLAKFHRLATSPATLRFSFVRNPYARLVSAWANKFHNKPLAAGDSLVDTYLKHRKLIDSALPEGRDRTLAFDQFARFAAATASARLDAHWQTQDDLVNMPGLKLDFIGKVETFENDFVHVSDHIHAASGHRLESEIRLNASDHRPWQSYYAGDVAGIVYRAYERDFDRYGYSRAIV